MKKLIIVLVVLFQVSYAQEASFMDKAGKMWDKASENVSSYMDEINIGEVEALFDINATTVALEVKACRKKGVRESDIGKKRTMETYRYISEEKEKRRLSFMVDNDLQKMDPVLTFNEYVSVGTCISSITYYHVE